MKAFDDGERQRLVALTAIESASRLEGYRVVAGVDEAGRGPLAGPVIAAACIIPADIYICGVDDSKKLTAAQRVEVFERIVSDARILYAVDEASVEEIDTVNILQATMLAMRRAVAALELVPDLLLVDGLHLPYPNIPCKKLIRGDSLSQSIAAASILAKVTRDRLMQQYHEQWPEYGFGQHKGYGTAQHRKAIERLGPCPIHRLSFEPLKSMAEMDGWTQWTEMSTVLSISRKGKGSLSQ
ncbi:MAG: ribonuclease HII [Nitrosomonas sp.]|nr:MAG: ribonuclease HII [Nitrosomonas sp.]